jgi:hypothetical protein
MLRVQEEERGNAMAKIDELKREIAELPAEQASELFRWLSDREGEKWDREIEEDSRTGKLDFLLREARDAKSKGTLKEL